MTDTTNTEARAVARAEAAGEHDCAACSFRFFLTVDACPACGTAALVSTVEQG